MEKENISKEWNWQKVINVSPWLEPAPDAYYLAAKWSNEGKKDFLDFGCGLGRHSLFFASKGFNVASFDLSLDSVNEVLKRAKKLNLNIEVKLSDMHHVDYPSNSFDAILAYHVISHTNLEKIQLVADELFRLLRKGGEVYFDVCSDDSWIALKSNYPKMDSQTYVVNQEGPEFGIPHLCLSLKDIKRIFSKFELVKITHKDVQVENDTDCDHKHFWVLLRKK